MTTVLQIIREHLVAHRFDGLVSYHADCSCVALDLAPCGEVRGDCSAGVLVPCDGSCDTGVCSSHIVARADGRSSSPKGGA